MFYIEKSYPSIESSTNIFNYKISESIKPGHIVQNFKHVGFETNIFSVEP